MWKLFTALSSAALTFTKMHRKQVQTNHQLPTFSDYKRRQASRIPPSSLCLSMSFFQYWLLLHKKTTIKAKRMRVNSTQKSYFPRFIKWHQIEYRMEYIEFERDYITPIIGKYIKKCIGAPKRYHGMRDFRASNRVFVLLNAWK